MNFPLANIALAQESITLGIAERAADFYNWGLGIGVILALGVIVYGGFMYITSAGNTSRLGDAKKWITAAITGLLILFSSFLILNTINPELTNLESIIVTANKQVGLKITKNYVNLAFLSPPPPFCYEACRASGNTHTECKELDPCPDLVCPLQERPRVSSGGSWLACRPWPKNPNHSGAVCPWNEGQCKSDHSGVDLGADLEEPVYAIESGYVKKVGYTNDACGLYLYLKADSGRGYGYCHLYEKQPYARKILSALSADVETVQNISVRVVAGEHIAFNGESGNAKSPHIHFSVHDASCGGSTKSCQVYPGCYNGKINPTSIVEAACLLRLPVGDLSSGCPGGSLERCLEMHPANVCAPSCLRGDQSSDFCFTENEPGCSVEKQNCCSGFTCVEDERPPYLNECVPSNTNAPLHLLETP